MDKNSIERVKEIFLGIIDKYGYKVEFFHNNWRLKIQHCEVCHEKHIVRLPKYFYINDLYCCAHEIGHIINHVNGLKNTEKSAWDVAYNLCKKNGVPLEDFRIVRKYSLNTHKLYR